MHRAFPAGKCRRRASALSACNPRMAATDTESVFQGYAQAGQTEWIENEIKWGTDYLLKTIKNNQENVTLVYQARPLGMAQTSAFGVAK